MKKILISLFLLFFLTVPVSACAAIKFREFAEYKTVLKTTENGIDIVLLAEVINGKEIKLQELDYFTKIIRASLKHFPQFRENRFPKPHPLKKRADKTNLIIVVIAGEKTKNSVCAGNYSPAECETLAGVYDREGNTIFLFSDFPTYYNFMFENPTLIHEMFHFQTTLYDEAKSGDIEEELARQFETYIFFRLE